jgi:4-hydroxy-tetrahydrodipicolinate synthase
MQRDDWAGVIPAVTTPFSPEGAVDHEFLAEHVRWLVDSGCDGVVPLCSLGEANTLRFEEKVDVVRTCRAALDGGRWVVAGIAGMSTAECVALAQAAASAGSDALMVLPVYVYQGDWRETRAHFRAVIEATPLPCMLYNNPIAYGTDVIPEQVRELADACANLHAVKESSGDVRRVTALKETLGDRIAVFAGLDDMIVEAVAMGADGWIAGLANALPVESVRLFELACAGRSEELRELYEWFLPLLRLDTVPKFVQLIKLVQEQVGRGSHRVRPPRLPVEGVELEALLRLVGERLGSAPGEPRADGRDGRSGSRALRPAARA